MDPESVTLVLGDLLKIERRYVVDGVVTRRTDKGRFAGVQVVGTSEHIALEDPKSKAVRFFPLHAVSEITLVQAAPRAAAPAPSRAAPPSWDPGVA